MGGRKGEGERKGEEEGRMAGGRMTLREVSMPFDCAKRFHLLGPLRSSDRTDGSSSLPSGRMTWRRTPQWLHVTPSPDRFLFKMPLQYPTLWTREGLILEWKEGGSKR